MLLFWGTVTAVMGESSNWTSRTGLFCALVSYSLIWWYLVPTATTGSDPLCETNPRSAIHTGTRRSRVSFRTFVNISDQAFTYRCKPWRKWLLDAGTIARGVLPYHLGGGVPLGSRKSYPLQDQTLQILWPSIRPKMLNCSWFQSFVSNPVKRDPILYQFSMIARPFTRPNGLKTIPSPAAHTCIANIWEYSPGDYRCSNISVSF